MTLDLSVAMLVREPPIERLVALIDYMSALASEFVIVDTGSSPETIQAMVAMNKAPWGLPKVLIIQREWRDDFSWARNEGLDKVTRKWTLVLDPDELPSFKMMEHIRSEISRDDNLIPDAWLHWTKDYYAGREDPYAEYQWHIRLFRTGVGRFYRPLDELISLGGLREDETRNTHRVPKAPKESYLIHSKGREDVDRSKTTYDRIRREQGLDY